MSDHPEPSNVDPITQLAIQAAEGDERARDQLCRQLQPLLYSLAKHFRAGGFSLEDWAQEGALGLVKAIADFDPSRGLRFSTLAHKYALNSMRHAYRQKALLIRQSYGVRQKVKKAAPDCEDPRILAWRQQQHPVSLEELRVASDSGATYEWPDLRAWDLEHRVLLWLEVDRLPEDERAVVMLCGVQGHTFAEAAALLGLSSTWIGVLMARARKALRQALK